MVDQTELKQSAERSEYNYDELAISQLGVSFGRPRGRRGARDDHRQDDSGQKEQQERLRLLLQRLSGRKLLSQGLSD